MTSMMPSQQRFGAPTNNNPGQPARPRQQAGGDTVWAGGSPYFDERTGQARQPARQSGGMDMSAYRPGQAQSQQQSFGSVYNPNANERLPGNFGQPPQQNAGRQPASFGDMQFAGGAPYFDERTGQARQPAFQMAPAQTPWGQSMDPFAERDAFVNQINQQRMQNQIAFNSGGPTNPAAGMNPGIDYQRAMQQAGLGGGAPSMAPDYGDSLIARLNQQFGPGSPPPPPLRDGGMSHYQWSLQNPGHPLATPDKLPQFGGYSQAGGGSAYQPPGNFGGLEAGMMQQFAPSRPQQAPPAYYPGFDPQTQNQFGQPMQAQPFPAGPAFSPQPTPGFGFNEGYGFGGPSLPQPAPVNQTGNASLGFQDWMRAGSPGAGQWHTMDHQTGVDATGKPMSGYGSMLSAYWAWVESQGGSRPGGGSQRPNAPPPSQGGGFKPQPGYGTPPERRGMGRTADWRDGDGDGVDDRDQDGPGMPAYGRTPAPAGGKARGGGSAGEVATRPVSRPSRQPSPPPNPRAAADAVRSAGGSRSEGNDAWRAAHSARINSQQNRNWLASQSGANRKIYQMLQKWV